jgi:hypothetical protein
MVFTMSAASTASDPRELLKLLKAADLRTRLQELAAEQRALRVLLRAAIARESAETRKAVANG